MKFERLRRAVEECETDLRENFEFSDCEIETAKSKQMYRLSGNWFYELDYHAQTAVMDYRVAIEALTKAERDETERMRKETK